MVRPENGEAPDTMIAEGAARPTPTVPDGSADKAEEAAAMEETELPAEAEPQQGMAEQKGGTNAKLDDLKLGGADAQQTKPAPAAKPKPARPVKEENIAGSKGYTEDPVQTEDPKGQIYDRLEAADKQRRIGNCSTAIARYESLLRQPDLDANQKSRAQAGIGLCREVLGDSGKANESFKAAREINGSIDTWIKVERTKTAPAEKSAPRKKKSKKGGAQTASPFGDSL